MKTNKVSIIVSLVASATTAMTINLVSPSIQRDPVSTFSSPPTRPTALYTSPVPQLPFIKIMSIGDSLSYGVDGSTFASYRGELSRLMNKTGQPHEWTLWVEGGTKCSYWASRIADLIDTHRPKIIFLNCGTNDTPSDNTEADYRVLLSTAITKDVQIVASYIGVPDMKSDTNRIRPYIIDWMLNTNLAIQRALVDYPQVRVANMWQVPANIEWLQTDGIHLTGRSEAAYAQLFYKAVHSSRGWKTFSQMGEKEICGLSGTFRVTDPWPTNYRVCTN